MVSFLFIFLICILLGITFYLLAYILELKREHQVALVHLHHCLEQLNTQLKTDENKVKFSSDFHTSFSKTQTQLNKDILDLQVLLLEKTAERR